MMWLPEALITWGHRREGIQWPPSLRPPSCVSECRPWTHFSTSNDVKCRRKRQWFWVEKAGVWEEANTKPFPAVSAFLSSALLPPARLHGSESELPWGVGGKHLIRSFGENSRQRKGLALPSAILHFPFRNHPLSPWALEFFPKYSEDVWSQRNTFIAK